MLMVNNKILSTSYKLMTTKTHVPDKLKREAVKYYAGRFDAVVF